MGFSNSVDGRNPKQPPGMYKTLYIIGYLPYHLVSQISSINSIIYGLANLRQKVPHQNQGEPKGTASFLLFCKTKRSKTKYKMEVLLCEKKTCTSNIYN